MVKVVYARLRQLLEDSGLILKSLGTGLIEYGFSVLGFYFLDAMLTGIRQYESVTLKLNLKKRGELTSEMLSAAD